MPVAEKTHRTKKARKLISVSGEAATAILEYAKRKDPHARIIVESPKDPSAGYVKAQNTKWYKATKAKRHPGISLRIRRENAGLTQAQLSELTGLAVSNISAIENGHRSIAMAVAKKLAEALGRPIAEFCRANLLAVGYEQRLARFRRKRSPKPNIPIR